ncbi:MAG TPA: cystathionine beta-lyase [Noviherbaspirillum sp.]|nr:cystathionine beta-lyase [Noviherbaspirillum sp.]
MSNNASSQQSPSTFLCHGFFNPHDYAGVVNPPVFHASTVLFRNFDDLEVRSRALSSGEDEVMYYGRFGTPQQFELQNVLAHLEGGHRSLLVPSGLSACVSAIAAFVKAGDHVLVSSSVYGPTRHFIDVVLTRADISVTYFNPNIGAGIAEFFRPNTVLVFAESPGSQTFEVQDIPAIAEVAHRRGAVVVLDNTWATPLYFKAFEHGVDVSVHSATKYIVGHSDAQMGLITTNSETWQRVREHVHAAGLHAAPDDVYLAQRGLRTMAVRLERHQASALAVADWLAGRPEVEQILHPALPGAPGHTLWRRDFTGSSGLFSVVLKPRFEKQAFKHFIDSLSLFGIGFSWGGFESLVMPFDPQKSRPEYEWPYKGFSFRLQIGLESPADLIACLDDALRKLHQE